LQHELLLPPHVDQVGVRVTLLDQGMSEVDVERIMGAPAQAKVADERERVSILKYPAEPIATTVTITDGKVSGVALDVAGVHDPALPNFGRAACLGLSQTAVLQMLGSPADLPAVSVFLIDVRVAAKKAGRRSAGDILVFALPLAPDRADDKSDDMADRSKKQRVAVGMKASELRAQFGAPKLQVAYTFRGRPAEYPIHETNPDKSFGRFTFIDGILTEFADGGNVPLNQVLDGR
jgi:hypothetical protein